MSISIRPVTPSDTEALVELTFLAFEPIFHSFSRILGATVYPMIYPDWKAQQRSEVETQLASEKTDVRVAEQDGRVVGMVSSELNLDSRTGEIQFLVVHPEYQNAGVGTALNEFALDLMREAGMTMAVVGTGGDESHAPARRAYEKVGFIGLPLVRYYKRL